MASAEGFVLAPLPGAGFAGCDALWPRASKAISVHGVEPMHVLSLRHLPGGGASALAAGIARHGVPGLPGPGQSCGIDPRLIWRSPSEALLLTQDAALSAKLLVELPPTPDALACAIDLSAGTLVVELQGSHAPALLSRLVDASALPAGLDQASRVRLADIAAVVWREAPDRFGLLVDRAHGHYLARWLSYAADAI